MTRKLRILLVQGHRNSTGGNPAEIRRTAPAARAIQAALREVGHTADMLQFDNDWWPGSLDSVGIEVARRHASNPYDLMLDIHFESNAANTRGVFAIVPDGDGLRTHTSYRGSDSWASNTLDVIFAESIAKGVADMTRLQLRQSGVVRPGVMSERQTGVGGQGYRLAMFGYTVHARDRMVRLVLELGNLESDKRIIGEGQFYARAAEGVVLGIQNALAGTNVVEFAKPVPPTVPPFGTIVPLEKPRLVSVTVNALNVRKWAETSQPIMRVLARDNVFWVRSWIVGENVAGNPIWWIMGSGAKTDLLWRVWSGGTNLGVDEILALPVRKEAA